MKQRERIPLHDHSDRNSGGELDRHSLVRGGISGGTVGAGSPPSGGGGGTSAHALDGPLHTNLDSYVKATRGGEETVYPLGSLGSAATVDPANGNWQYGTVDDDLTLTIADARTGTGNSILVELIRDGAGPHTFAFGDSNVVNASDLEAAWVTTDSTSSVLVLIQRDGANWYGFWAGSSGSGGGEGAGHYEVLMDGSSPPAPLEDGSGFDWLYVWVP